MNNNLLQTPVDTLVELVNQRGKIPLKELEYKLNVPIFLIERWLEILEEYGVIKTHYQGLEGYVYPVESDREESSSKKEENSKDIEKIKESFIEKSRKQGISDERMKELWPFFIKEYEEELKQSFEEKAKNYGIEDPNQREVAWEKYKQELEKL